DPLDLRHPSSRLELSVPLPEEPGQEAERLRVLPLELESSLESEDRVVEAPVEGGLELPQTRARQEDRHPLLVDLVRREAGLRFRQAGTRGGYFQAEPPVIARHC